MSSPRSFPSDSAERLNGRTVNGSWLGEVKDELGEVSIDFPAHTIFKVPPILFNKNQSSYTPCIVSIGPFHHGKSNLQSMEDHKRRYLLSLLCRTGDVDQTLNACGDAMLALEEKARACYAESISSNQTELAKMLLVDGCFMIELFLRYSKEEESVTDDPVFGTAWMKTALRRDLTLLENQIPLFVLEQLFRLTIGSNFENSLLSLKKFVLLFFSSELNLENDEVFMAKCSLEGNHLLDLIRMCYIDNLPPQKEAPKVEGDSRGTHLLNRIQKCCTAALPANGFSWLNKKGKNSLLNQYDRKFIRPAKALQEAGIEFVQSTSQNLLDLKFHTDGGKLEIPQLRVHGWTEPLFRNLMAFEQSYHHCPHYITSYIFLLDRLIDTTQDVNLLEKRQILKGTMGDAQAVADLFNSICNQVVLNDFYFEPLCNEADTYCRKMWPRHRASLLRDYFPDPWKIVAFVVAVLLLIFTATQAVFSVLSYFPH